MSITYRGIENFGPLNENENGIISATVNHSFHFDGGESPLDIMGQSQVPARRSKYPSALASNKNLFCLYRSVSSVQEGDGKASGKYIVACFYTNDLRADNTEESSQEEIVPWKLPPYDINIYPIDVTKQLLYGYDDGDVKGEPSLSVLNSAGDPLDAQTVEQNACYQFSYNLQHFDDRWIDEFADTINNSDTVVIDSAIPEKKGRIRNLGASFQRIYDENGNILYKFWKVNVEIERSAEEWKVELMDLGLFALDGTGKRYRIYTDNDGNFGKRQDLIDDLIAGGDTEEEAKEKVIAVDTPQKLAADGTLYSGDTAHYLTFYTKAYTNWGPLSLPKTVSGQTSTSKLLWNFGSTA